MQWPHLRANPAPTLWLGATEAVLGAKTMHARRRGLQGRRQPPSPSGAVMGDSCCRWRTQGSKSLHGHTDSSARMPRPGASVHRSIWDTVRSSCCQGLYASCLGLAAAAAPTAAPRCRQKVEHGLLPHIRRRGCLLAATSAPSAPASCRQNGVLPRARCGREASAQDKAAGHAPWCKKHASCPRMPSA